ncbi:hypothetical protein, partial [Escherichia coli]|uniref:hypothetical protein n=1 Tax=Escherichia coli TaxID=562 RepID=UPI001BDD1A1C
REHREYPCSSDGSPRLISRGCLYMNPDCIDSIWRHQTHLSGCTGDGERPDVSWLKGLVGLGVRDVKN